MKKITASFFVLLLACCAQAFAADNPRAEFEERRRAVAARMEAATVWVVGEDDEDIATGSGFIVGEGLVVTNSHVVDALGRGKVIYVLNDAIPATKAHIVAMVHDEKKDAVGGRDFALLRFAPPKGVTLPILTFNLEARRMDRVSAWGYPALVTQFDSSTARLQEGDTRGLKAPPVVYTEGTINSIVNDRLGASIIHSAAIAGGNSGGPLVNGRGEVVGINTWGYKEEDEGAFVNAAQPAPSIAAFLAKNGVTPKLAEGQQLTASSGNPPRMRTPEEPAKPGRSGRRQEAADGGRRNVGSFSVLVPHGWSVADEEKDTILLGSNDGACSVAIVLGDLKGKSTLQAAEAMSKKLGGTRPKMKDDVFVFTFSRGEIDTTVFVGEVEGEEQFVMISISGDADKPGVSEILDSVEDN